MSRPNDPVEQIIYDALIESGLKFSTENHPQNHVLDFFIPAIELHIECKRMHSERSAGQVSRSDNIILIVGIRAARHYAGLLRLTNSERERSIHRRESERQVRRPMGLSEAGASARWTEDEVNMLIAAREAGLTAREVGELVGRTQDSVKNQIKKLKREGRVEAALQRWSSDDDAKLARLWPSATIQALGTLLNRSPDAVQIRANRLGLHRSEGRGSRPEHQAAQRS